MDQAVKNPILESIRRSLGKPAAERGSTRPPVLAARDPETLDQEITNFIQEVNALAGEAQRLNPAALDSALSELVGNHQIKRAALWSTPGLARLQIAERLAALGVEIASPFPDKHTLAQCDLGVTEADFALPETGTLGLLSSNSKPRAFSLVPRVHLALISPAAIRADLHDVFFEAKDQPYLVFITGPSRTADIELTVSLGVHGPKTLAVWVLED